MAGQAQPRSGWLGSNIPFFDLQIAEWEIAFDLQASVSMAIPRQVGRKSTGYAGHEEEVE